MSDGRAYDSNKDEIHQDDFKKFFKLSSDVIIGATGSALQAKSLFKISNYWFEKAGEDIKNFAKIIRAVVLEDVPLKEGSNIAMHVMICGRNRIGESSIFTFTNDPDVDLTSAAFKTNGYLCLGDKRASSILNAETDCVDLLTVDKATEIQKRVNNTIADLTPKTVNKVVFQEVIYIE